MGRNNSEPKRLQFASMHTIVILFGIGAWVAVNGIWVELPVLLSNPTKSLPEGWSLPSYLAAISQVANIGPLIVMLMQVCCSRYYHQTALIYIILMLGTISCFLLCFFWDETACIAETEYSIGLFCLFFGIAFVDCTSSVTFLPFMKQFDIIFLTTYFIGEGLSGFLPSIAALIQGASFTNCVNESYINATTNETEHKIVTVYESPRYSIELFFGFLFVMMIASSISFVLLNKHGIPQMFIQSEIQVQKYAVTSFCKDPDKNEDLSSVITGRVDDSSSDLIKCGDSVVEHEHKMLTKRQYTFFYFLIFLLNCLTNGVLTSLVSYSSLPYGQTAYHFSATLGAMANPVAALLAIFFPLRSHVGIGIMSLLSLGFGGYLIALAVNSPCPVLVNSSGGAILMVIAQVLCTGTASFTKVSIAQVYRKRGHKSSLVWYGAVVQLGSLIGAATVFPLVNIYYFFTSGDPCNTVCP